jgi:hypothetical protein
MADIKAELTACIRDFPCGLCADGASSTIDSAGEDSRMPASGSRRRPNLVKVRRHKRVRTGWTPTSVPRPVTIGLGHNMCRCQTDEARLNLWAFACRIDLLLREGSVEWGWLAVPVGTTDACCNAIRARCATWFFGQLGCNRFCRSRVEKRC